MQFIALRCSVDYSALDSSPQQVISGTLSANPPLMLHILAVYKEEDLSVKKRLSCVTLLGPELARELKH